MLKKIQYIKNLGVFDDFNWDSEVRDKSGSVQSFQDINIIYGRNYSGKTTLSRILRALETGVLSDKYGSPSFQLKFSDNSDVTFTSLCSSNKIIRVFNEDFIRDNLRFITNPDESIEPFAILGDDNNKLTKEIEAIEIELGIDVEGKETGLFAEKVQADAEYKKALSSHKQANDNLEKQLSHKATNKKIGIKYLSKLGEQNYTITILKQDIKRVNQENYIPLNSDQIVQHEKLINEKVLPAIPKFSSPKLNFQSMAQQVEMLITKPIGKSDKIQELVKDAVLNRWVKDGRSYHRNKHEKCAFCNNEISFERWAELDKHFDEESERLEKSIDELLAKIEVEKITINTALNIEKSFFYYKFHEKLKVLDSNLKTTIQNYQFALDKLTNQLKARKDDILNTKGYEPPTNFTEQLEKIWKEYNELCTESELFSNSLNDEKKAAQSDLRLKEVADYLLTIDYQKQQQLIKELNKKMDEAKQAYITINENIAKKHAQIEAKKNELSDEKKGAKKVNEYLNNFLGHQFLTLEAKEDEVSTPDSKRIRFEVFRDGAKAYHLSEGECSLLAFCYFLAKLDDVSTKGSKPIIWIDDPISSLDCNHIFFIYSLLNVEIVQKGKFAQLFVSTHNLDFLKYLKRLKDSYINTNTEEVNCQKAYFLVVRQDKKSTLQVMPSYLKKYVTEFNYLFHQIHKCASIDVIDDTNYVTFYNFANNVRKFFEIYLYYKYPHEGMTEKTLSNFFGKESIPAVLTNRINNEYSHLCGVFERGASPIEVPEMQTSAKQIIESLKKDKDQYSSLMKSIDEL